MKHKVGDKVYELESEKMLELLEEKQPEQVLKEQVRQIEKENEDLIHNPPHYNYSKYEPINVIKAWNLDFDLGNVVKYIARCNHKGNKLQDLYKALEYLQHEIKSLEG